MRLKLSAGRLHSTCVSLKAYQWHDSGCCTQSDRRLLPALCGPLTCVESHGPLFSGVLRAASLALALIH